MNIFAGAVGLFLGLAIFCGAGLAQPLVLTATPLDLHPEDSSIHRVGRLDFRGGLSLTSPDSRFGGVSGLVVSPDGRQLTGVTDRGDWVRLIPRLSPDGELKGVANASIGRLYGRNGKPLRKRRDRDAESLIAIDKGFIASFEHHHRLRVYRGGSNPFQTPPTVINLPVSLKALPANAGLEALAGLKDGRLIALAEDYPRGASFSQGWIQDKNGWRGFRYQRHARFLPTGAATLPNADLLVLERRFSLLGGFGTRLVAISPASIIPDGAVSGRELARLEAPLITENFEGVAAYQTAAGTTVLYVISDDNFLILQRTILLKFTLDR